MIAGTGAGVALVVIALIALAAMSFASSVENRDHSGGSPNN